MLQHREDGRLAFWIYKVGASALLVSVIVFVLVTTRHSIVHLK